jgi:hemoglobin-like flavoprotein
MNPELLRASFETILEREPAMTVRFYEILFRRYPAARPLFGANSSRAQQEMLQGALVAVIDNLDNATWLVSTLGALGAKHVAYGVTPEMFAWVGDALLTTLAEISGEQWTADVALAWQEAYGVIRDLMLAGMTDLAAPQPIPLAASQNALR